MTKVFVPFRNQLLQLRVLGFGFFQGCGFLGRRLSRGQEKLGRPSLLRQPNDFYLLDEILGPMPSPLCLLAERNLMPLSLGCWSRSQLLAAKTSLLLVVYSRGKATS
jgi:hypothetical protein